MRFNIRIDAVWQALLLLGGATAQNSYVILGDDGMHFRLGWLFNRTIGYDQVAAVFPRSWPLLYGVGARTNFRGVLGLTGSFHDVVEVRLKKRTGNWAAVFPVDRIAVSLEEPELFIEELSRRTGLAEPPDINALSKPRRTPTRAKPTRKDATAVGATLGEGTGGSVEARPGSGGVATAPKRAPAPKPRSTTAATPKAEAKSTSSKTSAKAAPPKSNGTGPGTRATARKRPKTAPARTPARPRRARSS